MATIISFFNHKGGVGKTTTVFNLGWMMAELGKRVLLVDLDSQCNLTGLTLDYKGVEDLEDFYKVLPANNVRDALAPVFEGQPRAIVGAESVQLLNQPNLFILPGHIDMTLYESSLSLAHQLGPALLALKNIPGSIRFLIDRTAEKYNIDYVLVDLNPSLGPINLNALMVSDYFVVPMMPDYFSAMAIRSLTRILPIWRKWAVAAAATPTLKEADYPYPMPRLQFAGTVIQRFQPYDGKPAIAFQKWIDDLNINVRDLLIPELEKNWMLDSKNYLAAVGSRPEVPLMEAKDFKTLMAKSHEQHVPVFRLAKDSIGSGAVKTLNEGNMDDFYELYEALAKKLFALVENRSVKSDGSHAA